MMSHSRILRVSTFQSYCQDAVRPAAIQSSNAPHPAQSQIPPGGYPCHHSLQALRGRSATSEAGRFRDMRSTTLVSAP
jgi:hypothetical protein